MLRLDHSAKLSQQMRLAPRMIQSMEILQMPMMALEERIEQELESNVALERLEPGEDPAQLAEERRDEQLQERLEEMPLVVQGDGTPTADDFARLSEMESRYADSFDPDNTWQRPVARNDGERDRKLDAMANAPARGESLIEQLQHQWSFADFPAEIAVAGRVLIDYLDEDGRLGADLPTILAQVKERQAEAEAQSAAEVDGSRSEEHDEDRAESRASGALPAGITLDLPLLERALEAVQRTLEPSGLAARDVRESLRLQAGALLAAAETPLERDGWTDVCLLLDRHFEDFLQNRLPKVEKESGMSYERLDAARERMARLRLSPGKDVVDDEVRPIVPDVLVEYDEDADRYVATLSDGRLPAVRVSPRYERMARDRAVDKATREFLATSVRNAGWLIDSIAQRRSTLLRVVEIVLDRQREWFERGPMHLRPLPMVEVADQLGVHVATVSRAVADKWMQTPRGLAPLRKFFSGGTETRGGEDVSWEAVKAQVREIVDAEDPTKPLSDQAIADRLAERGVTLARRTVVKYREQLEIPPARRRKRHGAAAASA